MEKLGSDYGLRPSLRPTHDRLPLKRERGARFLQRDAELRLAQRVLRLAKERAAQRRAEDEQARRFKLERLTYADLHPPDAALRAREYL